MLIVCPSCATSYMVDQASLGPAGRSVRCARCKATWFAGGPTTAPDVNAFVDGVIAEAEAQSAGGPAAPAASPPPPPPPPSVMPESTEESLPAEPAPAIEHLPAAPTLEPVADAPSLVPPIGPPPIPTAEPDSEDIETFAARRKRKQVRRNKARRSSRWTAIILVLFAFNVALVGARDDVVRFLPQTASLFAAIGLPVNLRHLKFENVRISRETQDGTTILVVQGSIVSASRKPIEVPRLRFAVRNAAGQEIYTWTAKPDRSIIGPGETLDFNSRLAAPPKDANDVMVRFFSSQDAAAHGK